RPVRRRPGGPRMNTTTARTGLDSPRRAVVPRGLARLIRTETLLFLRDPGTLFFALAFPTVLMLGMGYVIPGMRSPVEGMGPPMDEYELIHIFTPALAAVA